MTMLHIITVLAEMTKLKAYRFLQTYSLKQGIKKIVEKGIPAAHK